MTNNNEPERLQTLYRIKSNRVLFLLYSLADLLGWTFGAIVFGGMVVAGACGIAAEMDIPAFNLGLLLIPVIVVLRFLLIIWERKNQLYIITTRDITSKGGVLNRHFQTIRLNEIRSVSYTQNLLQQIVGCGNILISSAASSRPDIVLRNIDHVAKIHAAIERRR